MGLNKFLEKVVEGSRSLTTTLIYSKLEKSRPDAALVAEVSSFFCTALVIAWEGVYDTGVK